MGFPLVVPNLAEPRLFYRRCFRINGLFRLSLTKLVRNSPSSQREQPATKSPDVRIVPELGDLSNHGDDGFLHRFFRLKLIQPSLPRDGVNQAPVRLKEFPPSPVILQIAQAGDKTASSSQESFLHNVPYRSDLASRGEIIRRV